MMGRYNVAARLFSWGAMPIGAGLVGLLAVSSACVPLSPWLRHCSLPFIRVVTPAVLDDVMKRSGQPT
jgi:hypothetical protein